MRGDPTKAAATFPWMDLITFIALGTLSVIATQLGVGTVGFLIFVLPTLVFLVMFLVKFFRWIAVAK